MNGPLTALAVLPFIPATAASAAPPARDTASCCREQLWPHDGHICIRDVTGGGFQLLSSTAGASDRAPDGTRIVWNRSMNGYRHLLVLTLKGLSLDSLTPPTPGHKDAYADWSPDGAKIAYASMDDDEGWGNIWTITPDGKNNTQLTFGTMTDGGSDWLVA